MLLFLQTVSSQIGQIMLSKPCCAFCQAITHELHIDHFASNSHLRRLTDRGTTIPVHVSQLAPQSFNVRFNETRIFSISVYKNGLIAMQRCQMPLPKLVLYLASSSLWDAEQFRCKSPAHCLTKGGQMPSNRPLGDGCQTCIVATLQHYDDEKNLYLDRGTKSDDIFWVRPVPD